MNKLKILLIFLSFGVAAAAGMVVVSEVRKIQNANAKPTTKPTETIDTPIIPDQIQANTSVQSLGQVQVLTDTSDFSGIAPSNAKLGINTSTGKMFFVDSSGNWQVQTGSGSNPFQPTSPPIVATITGYVLGATIIDQQFIPVAGVVPSSHYSIKIITDISDIEGLKISKEIVGTNTMLVCLENITAQSITIPTLNFSILKIA